MKKFILPLRLALIAGSAFAQHDTARVDAARLAQEQNREYRGDAEFRDDRDFAKSNARTGWEIDRLNREVRQLRNELRGVHLGSRIRNRFDKLIRDTDRLTALYRQNRLHGSEVRGRAQELRDEIQHIRWMLRHR